MRLFLTKFLGFIVILSCLFLLLNCSKNRDKVYKSNNYISLKLTPSNEERTLPMSEIFSIVEYIPLESTNESFFGTISQLKVDNDNIFIFDELTNSIICFHISGMFKYKINN